MEKTLKLIFFTKINNLFNQKQDMDLNFKIIKYKILKDYYFFKKKNPMYQVCSVKSFVNIMFSQAYHGSSLLNLFIKKWFCFKVN